MRAVTSTIGQALVLVVVGLVVGLGANAVQGKNHIDLSRAYFKLPPPPPPPPTQPADPTPPEVTQPKFREMTLGEVIKVFDDEKTAYGLNVFVDARSDMPYCEGHIPQALQCDYYRLDYYLPSVLPRLAGAEKVIVYCNGGECEDSLHVCGELANSAVPWGNIYLFRGGWEEWKKSGQPIETGPKQE